MAAFRSNDSRRIFSGLIILGSFLSLGTSFAPQISLTPKILDPEPSVQVTALRAVLDATRSGTVFRKDNALRRLEELVLTHRTVSASV